MNYLINGWIDPLDIDSCETCEHHAMVDDLIWQEEAMYYLCEKCNKSKV